MADKKSFGEILEAFFGGKGFYIVLFLCVAVIGVSAYFLFTGNKTDVEDLSGQTSGIEQAMEPMNEDPEMALPPEVVEEPQSEEAANESLSNATENEETGSWTEQQAETAVTAQYVWPLAGEIDLPYSVTALVYNKKLGDWRTHDGIDIAAPLGTQVISACAGQVESVKTDDMGGMTVVIEHAGGLRSIYSNLAAVPTVYEGDSIMTGEVIGAVGTTAVGETKENPHLCFKMTLDGQSVNPSDYLPPR
ncbi:MAG: peptidoglycan DD-metalloendopeptidase family protein [Oscillospiraceae bacterium]|nr:peptidoglycan DD-metalloendopeptidase family protein [Oscillospiraceae bacterium]